MKFLNRTNFLGDFFVKRQGKDFMHKHIWGVLLILGLPVLHFAQDVGTAADTQMEGRFALQLSYQHLSRNFTREGLEGKVGRKIVMGKLSFRPVQAMNLYGFVGSTNFPNSYADDGSLLSFGGGLKFIMLGEVYVEEEDGDTVVVKAGVGLDFQLSRLQSTDDQSYRDFALTEFQGSLDLGLRIFGFVGYLGFKFSKISGEMTAKDWSRIKAEGTGLFSLFLGFNVHLGKSFVLVSEFAFFTESSWAFGLRIDL